ncbi:hypothetical protein R6Q57_010593 [Mikania cordata]
MIHFVGPLVVVDLTTHFSPSLNNAYDVITLFIRFYVAEVLLALECLHMLGIKPENILVREDGHVMVTDFDLSLRCLVNPTLVQPSSGPIEAPRVSGPCAGSSCIDPFCIKPTCQQVSCFKSKILPATKAQKTKADLAALNRSLPLLVAEPTEARSNSFVGTHEYLAPEIIKGEGHGSAVDWWTFGIFLYKLLYDWWTFGIFLYELLYGRTPFNGSGNDEISTYLHGECYEHMCENRSD